MKKIIHKLDSRFIFLTGFMGTGKSTVGSLLASLMKIPFYDVDNSIVENQGKSIVEIFASEGESRFREYESIAIEEIIKKGGPGIVALGGGALLGNSNRQIVKANGISITLRAEPETILKRLSTEQKKSLLMLCGIDASEVNSENIVIDLINELCERRKTLYDNHDLLISTDGKSAKEIASEIIVQLERLFNH